MNVHSLARTTPYRRRQLVALILEQGWTAQEAAESVGISERTAYKWLRRYREGGPAGLRDRSSRPRSSPTRLGDDWCLVITLLRQSRWTGPRIASQLGLARSTVARALQRAGLARLKHLEGPEPPNRYQRRRPGELVHLDVKKLGRIRGVGHRIHANPAIRFRGAGWEYVHVCVDDASRLAYVEVLADESGESTARFLGRAVAWYARQGVIVESVMSDNGGNYRSRAFQAELRRHVIRHLRTRPYRPRTNGKAERFIQTLLREWAYVRAYESSARRTWALARWLGYYNRARPHTGLAGASPIRWLRAGLNNVPGLHT